MTKNLELRRKVKRCCTEGENVCDCVIQSPSLLILQSRRPEDAQKISAAQALSLRSLRVPSTLYTAATTKEGTKWLTHHMAVF